MKAKRFYKTILFLVWLIIGVYFYNKVGLVNYILYLISSASFALYMTPFNA